MSDTKNVNNIPVIESLGNNILLVDYRGCDCINRESLDFARNKVPSKSSGQAAVDVLLNLKGTRSYDINLRDMVATHRDFNVGRAAWVIEGRIAGFLTRMFDGGNILSHKIAMFEDYNDALSWLRSRQ